MRRNQDRRSYVNTTSAQQKPGRDTHRWLPLSKWSVAVEIRGLGVDDAKEAARNLEKALEGRAANAKHTSCQNDVCKALGFDDGLAGLRNAWKPDGVLARIFAARGVDPEKAENDADLFARHPGDMDAFTCVRRRQLADRLFSTDCEWPRRVYTGYGKFADAEAARGEFRDWDWMARELVSRGFSFDGKRPAPEWEIRGELPALHLCAICHLRGENLLDFGRPPRKEEFFVWIHGDSDEAARERERKRELAWAVRGVLDGEERGWIEIVKATDSLAVLFSADGKFDFVFRGMREDDFRNDYAPFLRADEISPDDLHQAYAKWAYFEYAGCLDKDLWDAECRFYGPRGGTVRVYPGSDDVVRDHFLNHVWKRSEPRLTKCDKAELDRMGLPLVFRPCKEGSRCLFSDLVTVALFREFLAENPDWAKRRAEPPFDNHWEEGADDDPALVCWYDAYRFASWFGKKHGLAVELPPQELYAECSSEVSPAPKLEIGRTFDEIREKSPHGLLERADGMRFFKDLGFCEWLSEPGAAVNTLFISAALSINASPERDRCAPHSDYGRRVPAPLKIGFRLCCRGKI
ncbi:MAG: hypothetical protein J6T45_08745 [Fibrobacterales bacterium]|nr:hypothetical protein [Fibrobacterales bacterium]